MFTEVVECTGRSISVDGTEKSPFITNGQYQGQERKSTLFKSEEWSRTVTGQLVIVPSDSATISAISDQELELEEWAVASVGARGGSRGSVVVPKRQLFVHISITDT
jgi:hypothetical protein